MMPNLETDTAARIALLKAWLTPRLSSEQTAWLDSQLAKVADAPDSSALAVGIGLAPRKLGKADLALSQAELQEAENIRPDLDPTGWSIDQTARMLFVLASFDGDDEAFAARLGRLVAQGEVSEHIALLRGLPLYPAPAKLVPIAAEGIRTNILPVFEAVAHVSPFPREAFSEAQWNQMVLKALFIGSCLSPIQGLDERRNAELAEVLIDYVHERWAAGRPVSTELWRCVGPFTRKRDVGDLVKVLTGGDDQEKQAAALALAEAELPETQQALQAVPELAAAIRDGRLTWSGVKA
ncbi:EboA domain-containing protein [Methyloligella sp. 2.7D]|uniref:EboA domain-containing protein n=1 Tax=unclassified Methyloligella TaxID=2625955 RepID=UPI00157C85EB|nr:EboA domain-containing protein [Methyloligella sp. GL2]QKP76547.1 EboA domain-containing protein [Methyloligella sp. GL2]